jgi:Cu+-exporting ATPase
VPWRCLAGVEEMRTNVATHHVEVRFDPAVERAGYEVAHVAEEDGAAGMREVWLTVSGMGSDHCAGIVGDSIKRLSGVPEETATITLNY